MFSRFHISKKNSTFPGVNSSFPRFYVFSDGKRKIPARPLGRPKAAGWVTAKWPQPLGADGALRRSLAVPPPMSPASEPPLARARRRSPGHRAPQLELVRADCCFGRCPGLEERVGSPHPGGLSGGTAAAGTGPRQHQTGTRGFVGSIGPSEGTSFENCKENTVLQSL